MIELRIQEIAKKRGIQTITDFAGQARLAYDTASDLWHGRMKRIDLEVFNRVCMTLRCTPAELLIFTRDREEDMGSWVTLVAATA